MVFNPDGISYVLENHTKTQWTNHKDTIQEVRR